MRTFETDAFVAGLHLRGGHCVENDEEEDLVRGADAQAEVPFAGRFDLRAERAEQSVRVKRNYKLKRYMCVRKRGILM